MANIGDTNNVEMRTYADAIIPPLVSEPSTCRTGERAEAPLTFARPSLLLSGGPSFNGPPAKQWPDIKAIGKQQRAGP